MVGNIAYEALYGSVLPDKRTPPGAVLSAELRTLGLLHKPAVYLDWLNPTAICCCII
jgi:hypothetical protein